MGAARRAGFRWIETAWPDREDRERLPDIVAEEGIGVALLNCGAGEVALGERGFLNDPTRREEAELAFLDAAELAQRLRAPCLNVLVGRTLAGVGLARQREAVLGSLRTFAPEAAARGLHLLIEPVNSLDHPGYLAPTLKAATELIEQSASDGLGVVLDVYHVAREGDDPMTAIERYGDLIGHVQISDCPGRGQPGSGSLDIGAILERIAGGGYTGSIGLEYEPRGSSEASLAFLRDERFPVAF